MMPPPTPSGLPMKPTTAWSSLVSSPLKRSALRGWDGGVPALPDRPRRPSYPDQGRYLNQDQRERYLRREQFDPTPAQAAANPPGQVVVSYRGAVLGVAILHRSGIIESLFPSRWSGCTGGS